MPSFSGVASITVRRRLQTLTKNFQGNPENPMKSKLGLLTYISTNKELGSALLIRYIRRLSLAAISIHQSIEGIASVSNFKSFRLKDTELPRGQCDTRIYGH